ncbi:hypothetical protein Psta_4401 [Pirellula staleyi DSM 6068]|uniref:Cytochrome c domain-containing protein n=1 Tax=Pirellula staleyi (strain ATCC 27377 / DSM 6068 / ICPB 4128) TaxID=530564 RepID=D2R5W2_PIRSD|nr:c-type cytochrome domain-containing protein [Pirellula staleyi]ADB19047.1 hypothetical protein Psta_4401 [Pirellula staleyi DSM 6068]
MRCFSRLMVTFALLSLVALLGLASTSHAVATPEQRAEIAAISTLTSKAANLFKAGKFKESGEAVAEVQTRIEKLAESGDAQVIELLAPTYRRLLNAHAVLELEGITLPALKPLEAEKPMPKPGEAPAGGGTSFTKEVAPILVQHCGGCHVRGSRGMFSMASYDVLMKGPAAGKVVFPGNIDGSDLVVKIQDKEMPPSGAGIPEPQLATLKKWITEGAKFDGPDPAANLTALTAGTPAAAPPMVMVAEATGKETISFAKDIAPVLVASCTGCHGTNRPRENFSVFTFESLLKGGDLGTAILPGKPADSLLIKKLKGTADGMRMPQGMAPLADEVIAKFEKWIEEGAKFDGGNAKQSVIEIAALAKANSSTHEQLSLDRANLALSNWKLVLPDMPADKVETTNFMVLGNVGENTLADIGQQAESLAPKIATIFKAPADQALVKGRVSLYVFRERYDYSEFGKMVERRDLPLPWRGHFNYTIVDAYGVVVPPRAGDYSLQVLIGQQLAGTYIASLGKGTPRWFAEGSARVAASRLDGADGRVQKWDDAVLPVVSTMSAPDDFLTGKLPPEETDICAYSFVKFLMADAKRYDKLLADLRKGGNFDQSFSATYGGSPNQVAQAWVRKPPAKSKPLGKK